MPKRWTLTARRIEPRRFTFGVSCAVYRGEHLGLSGWGCCVNLGYWYVDLNYRGSNA